MFVRFIRSSWDVSNIITNILKKKKKVKIKLQESLVSDNSNKQ